MQINRYFGDRRFYRAALSIALPIMIQNGITNFVGMLDNIMVGRIGAVEMTGVSIANTLIFIFNLAIFGAISGAGIFGAQFYGKGDQTGVQYCFRFKLIACAILTLLGCAVYLIFGPALIRTYLRGEGNVSDIQGSLEVGYRYLKLMLLGFPAFVLANCYSGTLRETGRTVLPMNAGIAAVLTNFVFNYALIFGKLGMPKLGADGAAIATVISRYVELLIVMVFTHYHAEQGSFIRGAYNSMYIPGGLVRRIIRKGTPLILNEALWAFGQALLLQCYSIRSYDVVAATNISFTLGNVCNIAFLSMGSAIGIMVGQLLGAGKAEEARDANRKLTVFTELTCLVFGGIMIAFAWIFPEIFNVNAQIRQLATSFILISACLMPVNAYANAAYFTLRSGGKTLVTFLFDSVFACLVVAPTAYCLSRFTNMPVVLLYLCCQSMELSKCVIGFFMIRSGVWIQNIVKEGTT